MTALELAYDGFGERGAPVVILHGLLGSARNWTGVARQLATRHRVLTLDLRNHGRSPWAETMSFDEMAGDVAALIERQGLEDSTLIGHSLGGKVAMRLALTRGELVARLIVVDVAPVTYEHTFGPFVEATRDVDLSRVTRRADADLQLHDRIGDPVIRGFLLQNLVKTDAGFAWRVHLDALAANMPELLGFPSDEATYDKPTLFVAGGRSDYVRPEHWPIIRRWFPGAEQTAIVGAGHWPHVERPAEFLDRIGRVLP